jgi:hypothetical protein
VVPEKMTVVPVFNPVRLRVSPTGTLILSKIITGVFCQKKKELMGPSVKVCKWI